jgi:hypothetical protein
MQLVHVIPPAPNDRHEEHFPDGYTPEQILEHLKQVQPMYGCFKPKPGEQTPYTYYLDCPDTVVSIGVAKDKKFVETHRIQGPPATPAA